MCWAGPGYHKIEFGPGAPTPPFFVELRKEFKEVTSALIKRNLISLWFIRCAAGPTTLCNFPVPHRIISGLGATWDRWVYLWCYYFTFSEWITWVSKQEVLAFPIAKNSSQQDGFLLSRAVVEVFVFLSKCQNPSGKEKLYLHNESWYKEDWKCRGSGCGAVIRLFHIKDSTRKPYEPVFLTSTRFLLPFIHRRQGGWVWQIRLSLESDFLSIYLAVLPLQRFFFFDYAPYLSEPIWSICYI